MKKRLINGLIWLAISVVMVGYPIYCWHEQGCSTLGICAGVLFYGSCMFLGWLSIDQRLKKG